MNNYNIWVEKFRPNKLEDLILEPRIKNSILEYIKNNELANFLFHGIQGVGKTSLAKILPNELNREVMFINASLDNSLEVLRGSVKQFAQSVSFEAGKKILIFDEIDSTNNSNFLPALRPLIEDFHKNVVFISTCNNISMIPKPILSRFQEFNFNIVDRKWYAYQIFNRLKKILDTENVKYSDDVLGQIILKFFPDIRKIINFCQQYQLELENRNILYKITKGKVDELFKYLKTKDSTKIRELIISEWSNVESIYAEIYENMKDYLDPECVSQIILILAEYNKWHSLALNKEIHITACLLEISQHVKWK